MTELISRHAAPFNERAVLRCTKHWGAALLSSAIIFALIVALPIIMQTLRR